MFAFFGERAFECRKRYLLYAGLRRSVAERCIRQTESKRKLRRILLVDVARKKFLFARLRRVGEIGFRPSSVQCVVIKRLLAHRTRPAERQMPCRSSIAEQNIRQCVARLHSWVPRSDHCGNTFEGPRKR